MKAKLLLSAIALTLATNSFGLELYKARIISHKEWSTGDIKAVFNPVKRSSPIKLDGQSSVNVQSSIGPFTGAVNEHINIQSTNGFYIDNHTQETKTYRYTFVLCAEKDTHVDNCTYYFDEVAIDADGYVSNYLSPKLITVWDKAGTYKIITQTVVSSSTEYGNFSSVSESIATIS